MSNRIIKFENVYKEYRLGVIGGGTLRGDLQSWVSKVRGKEDPNTIVGIQRKGINGKRFLALNNVSFEVQPGDTLGIIGRNGAGKSTLLKILSRVTAPSRGRICANGRISSMLEVGTGFHPELTGRENIFLNGAILGMTKSEISKKLDDIIEFSEIEKFIDTPVKRYSSGMYVKLAFSVAAHLDSEILVMDEVLAVGDLKFQEKCLGKMSNIASQEGRTVLYVSHNMGTIRKLCNRCIVLDKGGVKYDGNVENAIEQYIAGNFSDSLFHDLTSMKRHGSPSLEAKLISIEIINRVSNSASMGEKIKFNIVWESKGNFEEVMLRCHVVSIDGTPVGIAYADKLSSTYGYNNAVFIFDTSILVPGKYNINLVLYKASNIGTEYRYDCINDALSIDIIQSKEANQFSEWVKGWGYTLLPRMEIER